MTPDPTLIDRADSQWWWFSFKTGSKRIQASGRAMGLSKKTHTREQALTAIKLHFGMAAASDGGAMTLCWFRDEILRRVLREGRRKGSVKEYRIALNHLINCFGEPHLITDIRRIDVGRFQEFLLTKTYLDPRNKKIRTVKTGPVTINKICRQIRAAFNKLLDDELIPQNPFLRFKKLNEYNPVEKYLNESQIQKFMAVLSAEKNEAKRRLINLYLFTGFRRQEILDIRRENIDLNAGTFKIVDIKNSNFVTQSLEIPAPIRDDVSWFLSNSQLNQPFRIMSPDHVTRTVKKYMRAANLPENFHLHSLRHTLASMAIKAGENIYKVKEYLGHSSVNVTEIYVSTRPDGALNTGTAYSEHKDIKKDKS